MQIPHGKALLVVIFFIFVAQFYGCKSAYPPCSEANIFRCNGNAVEMCDGEVWHPQYSCDTLSVLGEHIEAECVQSGSEASCLKSN
jgi:hypothetical protein